MHSEPRDHILTGTPTPTPPMPAPSLTATVDDLKRARLNVARALVAPPYTFTPDQLERAQLDLQSLIADVTLLHDRVQAIREHLDY